MPAGTHLEVAFRDGLSSTTSQVGDRFRTSVVSDVRHDRIVVIPAGSVVTGRVTEVQSTQKIGGRAKLALDFESLEFPDGESVPIDATFAEVGRSETKRDAVAIGGGAAAGALAGRLLGGKSKGKRTTLGAIVGAAVGTAIAASTEGEEIEIEPGTVVELRLERPVDVQVTIQGGG